VGFFIRAIVVLADDYSIESSSAFSTDPGAETIRDRILAVTVPAIDFIFAYRPGNVFVTARALLWAFRRKGWLHSSITPSKSFE